ncbi:MAG: hypothetical protein NXI10_04450 [bacterium]|nr:hypothetical protein [bacterium]
MKLIIVVIAFFGLQMAAVAGDELNRFERAEQAHMEKRFNEAITLLEKEAKAQPYNPSVFFNLGLAYKADKNYPKAIWAFEKTLKIQPKDSEAIQLIEACYAEMDSNQTWEDETGTFQRALIAMGSDFWSVLAIVFSLLGGICIILAKRTQVNTKRKWYVGTTVFSVITLFICIANASSSYQYEHSDRSAIVLNEVEFGDNNVSAEKQLKAGSKVTVEKWHKDGSASISLSGKTVKVKKGLAKI